MRSLRFDPPPPPRRARGDFARRTAAVFAVALGAAGGALVGGHAAAQSADCGPGTAGSVYPVADCMVLTSTNATSLGGDLTVSGAGFKPATSVSVQLHSSTVTLGSLTSNTVGAVDGTVSIPNSVPTGTHELDLMGINPDGTARELTATVQIKSGTSASSGLSGWFWAGISVLALALLGIAIVAMRGRRGRQVG
jgi:hypothetical protein